MMGLCDGRVAIVTGAGRGIGREHALALAREGARVVVNDIGAEMDGTGVSGDPANEVVDEIRRAGGEAIVNGDDVSSWDGAANLVNAAVSSFGGLDVLVNNAGILRDRMLVNMTAEDWDAVIGVHLRGSFAMMRHASAYWRRLSKSGQAVDARIVNTTSNSGLFGNVGQANYGAAKAGIASLTVIASMELGRYGVTVNSISPGADTRMTQELRRDPGTAASDAYDPRSPANIAPLVVWLASGESRAVTGRTFLVRGATITLARGWEGGPQLVGDRQWTPAELGGRIPTLIANAEPASSNRG